MFFPVIFQTFNISNGYIIKAYFYPQISIWQLNSAEILVEANRRFSCPDWTDREFPNNTMVRLGNVWSWTVLKFIRMYQNIRTNLIIYLFLNEQCSDDCVFLPMSLHDESDETVSLIISALTTGLELFSSTGFPLSYKDKENVHFL